MTSTQEFVTEIDQLREATTRSIDERAAERIDELIAACDAEQLESMRGAVAARLPDRGVHPGLHFFLVRLAARRGDREAAGDILARIIERLNQDADFTALLVVLARAPELLPPEVTLPLLVRAFRETDGAAVPLELIGEWRERFPDEPRLDWLAGLKLQAAGDEEAIVCFAAALEYLAGENDPEALEEAALPVLETLGAASAPQVTAMLRRLVAAGRYDEASTYFDFSLDALLEQGQAAELWDFLSAILIAHPEAAPLRDVALGALRRLQSNLPRLEQIIDTAGLADPATPFAVAFERYGRIIRFPPGGFVEHQSWGVAEILEYDGDRLLLRFPSRGMHEMQRAMAENALDRHDADDLRVLSTFAPDRLQELRDEDPVALVAAALKAVGGEGKPRDLRRLLTAEAISTDDWPAWWKRARARMEEDERLDLSQNFRDIYRLMEVGDGEEGVPLPRLNDKDDPFQQIRMLRRFLEQHPDARQRVIDLHSRRLLRWLAKRKLTTAQRLLVRIVLADWAEEHRQDLIAELVVACEQEFDLSELTNVHDQQRLLDLGLAEENWHPVAVAGMGSRVPAIRERARTAIEQRVGIEKARELYIDILEASPHRGDAVLEVATMVLDGLTPAVAGVANMTLFLKVLALVSEPERDAVRNRALRLLAPSGPIFARLHAQPPTPAEIDRVAIGLLSFRASDQYLNPIVDALEKAWGPEALEALRRRRRQEGEKIAARMDDDSGFPTVMFMSRASHEELKAEIQRVDLELRTTIPQSIRRAREHGDLRENAEYDAARLKQRQYTDRLEQLVGQLDQSAVIEDANVDGTFVSVGTEVFLTLIASGEAISYWLLGYNDSKRGPNVVSFQSEVGRALYRHRVGDELELPGAEGTRTVRVSRIEIKLPADAESDLPAPPPDSTAAAPTPSMSGPGPADPVPGGD